jgi:hypothetical protein
MTQQIDDVLAKGPLTRAEIIELQRAIEAGLLAREARASGAGFADATEQELRALEDKGEQARQRFIRANLGLVGMVSRQYAARSQLSDAELFQEGCIGLPACQLPTGSSRARAWLRTRQPDASLAWEDLSAEDRRALTEMLVDKTVIAPHPDKIDKDGRRHYLIRTRSTKTAGATTSSAPSHTKIPRWKAERLKAVHEARVKIIPRV